MTTIIFTSILLTHWFGDFVLQTQRQATNKSESIKYLVQHTSIYSSIWLTPSLVYGYLAGYTIGQIVLYACLFSIITFITHTLTDYITSKLSKRQYNRLKMNGITGFWSIIGLDQTLHLIQLFLTYKLLF